MYRSYYPHRLRELVSPVCGIFFFFFCFLDKGVEVVGGGFVINGAYPVQFTKGLLANFLSKQILKGNFEIFCACAKCCFHVLGNFIVLASYFSFMIWFVCLQSKKNVFTQPGLKSRCSKFESQTFKTRRVLHYQM